MSEDCGVLVFRGLSGQRRGTCRADSCGLLVGGALPGLDLGLVESPLLGFPKCVVMHQEHRARRRSRSFCTTQFCRLLVEAVSSPLLPLAVPWPAPQSPCTLISRDPARLGRTNTLGSTYRFGENSAVCQLLCSVSVNFYFWLQVSGKQKQMFLRMCETSIFKVHVMGPKLSCVCFTS